MFKEYFSLTSHERNGFFVLLILTVVLLGVFKVRQLRYEPEYVDLSALQDSVQRFYDSPIVEKSSTKFYKNNYENRKESYFSYKDKNATVKKVKPLVVVEINGASIRELQEIRGIGEFYAKNIVKERERIGGFTDVAQLLSVYGMTNEKLQEIKGQIRIDTALCLSKVLLNSADSSQLVEVYAISPFLAGRIVRYRERLGGFYDSRQLLDVFGVDEDRYQSIMCRVELDTVELRILDINNEEFSAIMRHPYIDGYKNTKAIFRYLDYGVISTWDEFCKIPNLDIEQLDRLEHYVKFVPKRDTTIDVDSTKVDKKTGN